ncbi:MAG: hypothetical protein SP1CHLAM54_08490 [Chlamydiia bacterium]|nr:hypothetical protein [Chlamydiia bacterium]MCH9615755.1 hypothetical protein [Chlamydiia bacterium]MCH9628842.1 hypothetical protein [Chlamydiia bacterium]
MLILCIFCYLFFDERISVILADVTLPKSFLKLVALPFGPKFHMALWPLLYIAFPKRLFLQLGMTLGGGGLLLKGIKLLVGRARPYMLFNEGISGMIGPTMHDAYQSLPSGHAFASMAIACSLVHFYPRWRFPLLFGALIIGFVRVSLNYHFVSDALAGMILAKVVSSLVFRNLNSLEKGFYYVKTKIRLPYRSPYS